jgi:hypothetical protein
LIRFDTKDLQISRRHVFGTYPAATYEGGRPLPPQSRVVFRCPETQQSGYFDLIAPFFDDFATRSGGPELRGINALVVLNKLDLVKAIDRTTTMAVQFADFESKWVYHQGSVRAPGQPERQIYITLYKHRLLSIVGWLRNMFQAALDRDHCVVFGNGVCGRMLCGIKLPPGVVEYS